MFKPERARRGDDARVDLKETAIDCFAKYGYQGTSIDRIARESGVTKGAIYYHYKDKNDLLAAAVADRVAEFEDRVQSACQGAEPEDSIRRIVAVCTEHAVSNDRPRFAIKLMVEAIDTHDPLLDAMRGMMRRFRAFLRNIVRAGQESGAFRRDADADQVAATLTSAVIGAETQYYLDPERFRLEQTLGTFLAQLFADLRAADSPPGLPMENTTAGGIQP
ncbi:MAG TPA: TetR/AcrR family transcriptional regulator [Candidatus Limnocylindrales bacterium]|nr:TetR/AcrR family transcriptional regulator [Candidatus Limnocylindrales bacterium]